MLTQTSAHLAYQREIDDICRLNWTGLSQADLTKVAWAYYYFSIQFRENLEVARSLFPDDERLLWLDHAETTRIVFLHSQVSRSRVRK